MKKISCNIIRDILPLYLDDVVSDETKQMVEEHLQSCASCRDGGGFHEEGRHTSRQQDSASGRGKSDQRDQK